MVWLAQETEFQWFRMVIPAFSRVALLRAAHGFDSSAGFGTRELAAATAAVAASTGKVGEDLAL